VEAYLGLAKQHLEHGRRAEARQVLELCQKAVPADPRAAQQLAKLPKT
jgi:hypothetical protein